MSNGKEIKKPEVEHILDPKTVVSSSDFTGILQGIPKDSEDVGQYSDVHSIPEQGGLDQLADNTDASVH